MYPAKEEGNNAMATPRRSLWGIGTYRPPRCPTQLMRVRTQAVAILLGIAALSACSRGQTTIDGFGDTSQTLRVSNRTATRIDDRNGVRLSRAAGNGVAWVEGSDFQSGTIDVDVRGREFMRQNYVGVAFHRKDDDTYEAVYVRPFNFRASDSVHKQHAVQYIMLPQFDFDRLRKDAPEEFENPVDASVDPSDWVKLRVIVRGGRVEIHVGGVNEAALEVRKLGQLYGGQVGLWVGNDSGGDFANLAITPAK
jgi:hypothetical protein